MASESVYGGAPRVYAELIIPPREVIEAGFRWAATVRDSLHDSTVKTIAMVAVEPLRRPALEATDATFEVWGRLREVQRDSVLHMIDLVRREADRREAEMREETRRSTRPEQGATGS